MAELSTRSSTRPSTTEREFVRVRRTTGRRPVAPEQPTGAPAFTPAFWKGQLDVPERKEGEAPPSAMAGATGTAGWVAPEARGATPEAALVAQALRQFQEHRARSGAGIGLALGRAGLAGRPGSPPRPGSPRGERKRSDFTSTTRAISPVREQEGSRVVSPPRPGSPRGESKRLGPAGGGFAGRGLGSGLGGGLGGGQSRSELSSVPSYYPFPYIPPPVAYGTTSGFVGRILPSSPPRSASPPRPTSSRRPQLTSLPTSPRPAASRRAPSPRAATTRRAPSPRSSARLTSAWTQGAFYGPSVSSRR